MDRASVESLQSSAQTQRFSAGQSLHIYLPSLITTVALTALRAPGTAKKGTNGCISNCGTKVKSVDSLVDEPHRIGYFEAWNLDRPCAHMDISKMTEGDYYTHVHWAFGNITETWEVDLGGQQEQFEGLLKLKNIQRVMSFGGWGFSSGAYTHNIFRNGVKDGNRQKLASNVVKFIVDNDLDGLDFDWEYPGVSKKYLVVHKHFPQLNLLAHQLGPRYSQYSARQPCFWRELR